MNEDKDEIRHLLYSANSNDMEDVPLETKFQDALQEVKNAIDGGINLQSIESLIEDLKNNS